MVFACENHFTNFILLFFSSRGARALAREFCCVVKVQKKVLRSKSVKLNYNSNYNCNIDYGYLVTPPCDCC